MTEENKTNQQEQPDSQTVAPPEPAEEIEALTKSDAIAGIFSEPGNTFSTIAGSVKQHYWVLPVIIFIIVNLISAFLFFSDEELASKEMDKQIQKVEQEMEKKVESGEITQEKADSTLEEIEKYMVYFVITRDEVVLPFILMFALSLVYLIGLKILKADFDYVNILNVIGLSFVVLAIGKILDVVISILTGDINTISLGLLINEGSVGESLYKLMSSLDVFVIWFSIIVAIGLSKISGIKSSVSYILVFGIWIVWVLVTSFVF